MGLTDRVAQWLTRSAPNPIDLGEWASMFTLGGGGFGGLGGYVPETTLGGEAERIEGNFAGYVEQAYRTNGPVFACMLVRLMLFSEARFQFRRLRAGRPGELFGSPALLPIEVPYPGGTTGALLSRAIQDVDLAGNWYGAKHEGGIKRLRPDWVTIVVGSNREPDGRLDGGAWAIDAELLGYVYTPGGPHSGNDGTVYLPGELAHWAPIPDPLFQFRGMSWLTPVVREIMGDNAATTHKLRFFENGATVNQVVTLDPKINPDNFEKWVRKFEGKHKGFANAYKTLYLGGGAELKAVGSDMKSIDFKAVQGAGETRIAAAAGVPPVIAGFSEGLEAATYSNYGQARRRFADGTIRPLWRGFAGAVSPLLAVPTGTRLWYDDRDIPFLQEDQKDAAEIQEVEARTIVQLIREGFEPKSVVAAVENDNWSLLRHTGLVSVQLQTPGSAPAGATPTTPAAVPALTNGNGNGA